MKKIGVFLLCFVALLGAADSYVVFAAEVAVSVQDLQIGDYFTLGEYNSEPIVWRYAADDDNGKLIVSDKILCIKTPATYINLLCSKIKIFGRTLILGSG